MFFSPMATLTQISRDLPPVPEEACFDPDAAHKLLSIAQQDALAALMEGESIRGAAEKAQISRNTLTRWIKSHPAFRAAYNAWRQELVESTGARLLRTMHTAAEVVDKAVTEGDAKIALGVLRLMGAKPSLPGPAGLVPAAHEIEVMVEEERRAIDLRFMESNAPTPRQREEREDIIGCARAKIEWEDEQRAIAKAKRAAAQAAQQANTAQNGPADATRESEVLESAERTQ